MTIREQEDVRLLRSLDEIWADVQEILSKRMKLSTYHSWVKPTRLVGISGGVAEVTVLNTFMTGWIGPYIPALEEVLCQVLNQTVKINVVVDAGASVGNNYAPNLGSITVYPDKPLAPGQPDNLPSFAPLPGSAIPSKHQAVARAGLNPKYTLDSFVVGSNNQFPHSAALAVAKSPGQAYNPLFIYGGVGLGKTHMMQAIGHQILSHSPQLVVRYVTCEQFTNEVITSIREQRMLELRKRYRQVDVLLIDDIQFLAGKESTQEEFFHTFNTLRNAEKQIVLSSDRAPKAIAHLEERLRSRFEWGLIADIQPPDLETRLAILQKKCQLEGMQVPFEVLEYIASMFSANIRELEGALIRANAYAQLIGTALTRNNVEAVLNPGGTPKPSKPSLTMDQIIGTVASHYHVESSELRSPKRSQDLALPRHVAMYLAHELLQMSFPRIADAFNRKHTSAIYANKTIKESLASDANLADAIKQIRRQLGN